MVSEQIRSFGKFCSQRQYVGRVIHSEFLMILSKLKAAETQGKRYMVHLHTHMHTHNPSAALSPSDDATVVRSREMYLHRSPALGPLLRASFRCAEPEASPTNHGDCTTVPLCCARPSASFDAVPSTSCGLRKPESLSTMHMEMHSNQACAWLLCYLGGDIKVLRSYKRSNL